MTDECRTYGFRSGGCRPKGGRGRPLRHCHGCDDAGRAAGVGAAGGTRRPLKRGEETVHQLWLRAIGC